MVQVVRMLDKQSEKSHGSTPLYRTVCNNQLTCRERHLKTFLEYEIGSLQIAPFPISKCFYPEDREDGVPFTLALALSCVMLLILDDCTSGAPARYRSFRSLPVVLMVGPMVKTT